MSNILVIDLQCLIRFKYISLLKYIKNDIEDYDELKEFYFLIQKKYKDEEEIKKYIEKMLKNKDLEIYLNELNNYFLRFD
jgi:hypothetical protein